ncbi:hypothetical protein [Vibrio sp. D431a]|nr:hypothetical protein [Vibrio sp. D431a]
MKFHLENGTVVTLSHEETHGKDIDELIEQVSSNHGYCVLSVED